MCRLEDKLSDDVCSVFCVLIYVNDTVDERDEEQAINLSHLRQKISSESTSKI